MSLEHDAYFIMQRQREQERLARQIANANRVRENTRVRLVEYKNRLDAMLSQGLNNFISLDTLISDISNIEYNLQNDPFYARDISFNVASYIDNIEQTARTIKKEKEQAYKNEINDFFYQEISKLKDPIVIEFAKDELDGIKNQLKNYNGKDLDDFKNKISNSISQIIADSSKKAQEYREQKIKNNKNIALKNDLNDLELELKNQKTTEENKEKQKILLEQIQKAKANIDNDLLTNDDMSNLNTNIDNFTIDENARKEVVKSIIKTLKNNDFFVDKPKIENDVVKITAKKPSGKQARCSIHLDGKINYRFDNYSGDACVNDVAKFEKELEEIYSLKIKDKRVLWENPDKISKGSLDINIDDKKTL